MQDGPVTPYYTLSLDKVYEVLNGALASEIVCVVRGHEKVPECGQV
jgi:hypothetical protein